MRLLERLRVLAAGGQLVEGSLVLGDVVLPQPAHDLQVLAAALAPLLPRHADGLELLGQPPDAHAEVEAPVGEPVDVGHRLGRVDGVALRHQADPGAQAHPRGDRGQEGQDGEGLEHPVLAADRDLAVVGVGIGRAVLVEQQHVLGHPEGVEAAGVGRLAQGPQELRCGDGADGRREEPDLQAITQTARSRPRSRSSRTRRASRPGCG